MLTHQKQPSTGEMVGEILPADLVAPAATPHRTTWARQQMLLSVSYSTCKKYQNHIESQSIVGQKWLQSQPRKSMNK